MKKLIAISSLGALVICCGGASAVEPVGEADGGPGSDGSSADGATGGPRGAPGTVVADGGSGAAAGAGPGGSTSVLPCGTAACLIPGESCCLSATGAGGFAFACVVGSTCPAGSGQGDGGGNGQNGNTASLKCTSAVNCAAGTVCCISAPNDDATSECKTTCGPKDAQLCSPSANPSGCDPAAPCSSKNIQDWGLPASFGTCGGKGN